MAARCLLLVWVKSAKGIPQPRANVFQERGRCWGILPSGGAVLGIVPGHGGHRHRQDLRQPVLDGGDDLEKMKSGLSSQKGITMLKILNDTTKKHRTKICLVLFGAPAGIRIPDTLIKRIQGASFVKFQKVRRNVILSYRRKIRLCTHRIVCIQCNALQPLSSYSGVQKVCKNVQTGKTKPNGQINHRFYGRV